MNITDLETKGIVAAKKANMDFWDLMKKITKKFFSELDQFRVSSADIYPYASGEVDEMADAVVKLIKKEHAYEFKGDIYFDISKAKDYGKLSHYKFRKKHFGTRVRLYDYYQHQAGDFLLWYKYKKSDGKIFWITKLGKGKPAWNTECPVMCKKYLKLPMDVHMGGVDNIFSHHENEIAIIEGLTGKKPAKYWIHIKHLMVEGKKMSKSLKNYYSLEELKERNFSMMAIKWLLLSEVYTRRVNFTLDKLKKFQNNFKNYKELIKSLKATEKEKKRNHIEKTVDRKKKLFFEALYDNLNFPKAFYHFKRLISKIRIWSQKNMLCKDCCKKILLTLKEFDKATGAFPVDFS